MIENSSPDPWTGSDYSARVGLSEDIARGIFDEDGYDAWSA